MIKVDLNCYRPLLDVKATQNYIRSTRIDIPDGPGLYAFWWIAEKSELLAGNRHIVLKGPAGSLVDVE